MEPEKALMLYLHRDSAQHQRFNILLLAESLLAAAAAPVIVDEHYGVMFVLGFFGMGLTAVLRQALVNGQSQMQLFNDEVKRAVSGYKTVMDGERWRPRTGPIYTTTVPVGFGLLWMALFLWAVIAWTLPA